MKRIPDIRKDLRNHIECLQTLKIWINDLVVSLEKIIHEECMQVFEEPPIQHSKKSYLKIDEVDIEGQKMISLISFYATTKICNDTTLSRILKFDEKLRSMASVRLGKKTFINKDLVIEYLRKNGTVRIRKSTEQYLQRQQTECRLNQKSNCPPLPLS